MWIWQQKEWPNFKYQAEDILPALEKAISAVAPLSLLAKELDETKQLELESQVLLEEALSTAKIEGEFLDRDSVRSSIANRLGVGLVTRRSKSSEVFIDVLLESIRNSSTQLTHNQLFEWHQMMFVEKPILNDLVVGNYRSTEMKVISGRFGKETLHFKAPCSNRTCIEKEVTSFLTWLKTDNIKSGYVKAAIAKFWFVTIHPFDDGNGRFSRIVAERCLAESEKTNIRLYSISTEIEKNKAEYYQLLENCQKGTLDITSWVIWFLEQISAAADSSMVRLTKIRQATEFWDKNRSAEMNKRQLKLVMRLLDTNDFGEGISRSKYKNLVSTSDATAARDLIDLVKKSILVTKGQGRSTKYFINNGDNHDSNKETINPLIISKR